MPLSIFTVPSFSVDVSEDFGAAVSEGKTGCQRLFDEILAREFGDYRYGKLHRLTVDTYSLQHPGRYMRTGKSFAAHLTGMYAALEGDGTNTQAINAAVQQWLNGSKVIERPEEPRSQERGILTVAHLHGAADADDHIKRVMEWARSTWEAWSDHHETAREWIEQAVAETRE